MQSMIASGIPLSFTPAAAALLAVAAAAQAQQKPSLPEKLTCEQSSCVFDNTKVACSSPAYKKIELTQLQSQSPMWVGYLPGALRTSGNQITVDFGTVRIGGDQHLDITFQAKELRELQKGKRTSVSAVLKNGYDYEDGYRARMLITYSCR